MNSQTPQDPFITPHAGGPRQPGDSGQNGSGAQPAAPSPQLLAVLVPAVMVFGGIVACAALWILSGGVPVIRLAGLVMLISDIGVAFVLRALFLRRVPASRSSDESDLERAAAAFAHRSETLAGNPNSVRDS